MKGSSKIFAIVIVICSCFSTLLAISGTLFFYDESPTGDGTTKLDIKTKVSGTVLPDGIVGRYTGSSLNENGLEWKDLSGKNNDIKVENIKGILKRGTDKVSGDYVYGSTTDGITIPMDLSGTNWTFFAVAKYNGDNTGRIFESNDKNWLAGWHAGKTGIAHYGTKGWVTPDPPVNIHGHKPWVQITVSKTNFYSNGVKRNIKLVGDAPGKITINMGMHSSTESSDWAVHEIIVYDKVLTAPDREIVEKYLMEKYIYMDIQKNIDFTKGYTNPHVQEDNKYVGTAETCRRTALKLGYKMWGQRTEEHASEGWKNICFFYPETTTFDGNPDDKEHLTGCTFKGVKVKDGCADVPKSD
jgi:hypothetical protein